MKTPTILFQTTTPLPVQYTEELDIVTTNRINEDSNEIPQNRELPNIIEFSNNEWQKKDDNLTEENSYKGFLPLLNNIQHTLTTNANKSLKSKITLLKNLRDNLLENIGKSR